MVEGLESILKGRQFKGEASFQSPLFPNAPEGSVVPTPFGPTPFKDIITFWCTSGCQNWEEVGFNTRKPEAESKKIRNELWSFNS